MKFVIQRVTNAKCEVDNQITGQIEQGFCVFIGVAEKDNDLDVAIDTYEDHRMALAFAPMAFTRSYIRINNPHVVTKSYPHYWEHLDNIGVEIEQEE